VKTEVMTMKRFLFVIICLSLVFQFGCDHEGLQSNVYSISLNEAELLLDIEAIPGMPELSSCSAGGNFYQPFQNTNELNIIISDTCGNIPYPQFVSYDLDNRRCFYAPLMTEEQIATVEHTSLFLSNNQTSWKISPTSFIMAAAHWISTISPTHCMPSTNRFPLFCGSIFRTDSYVILGEEGNGLYRIDYPSYDLSSLEKMYTLRNEQYEIQSILHVDMNEQIVYISFCEKRTYDLSKGSYRSGIMKVDYKNNVEQILFERVSTFDRTDDSYHKWVHTSSYQDGYWVLTEILKENSHTSVTYYLYNHLDNNLLTITPYKGYKRQGDVLLKSQKDGLYMYWIDSFRLYRWKIPS
jgi:hypothetical protein